MELNDSFSRKGIDPRDVLVMRHRPSESALRNVLPWLAAERGELYNAYQQTQSPKVEKAMKKAKYVASFIGHQSHKAIFVGLYRQRGWRCLTPAEWNNLAANRALMSWGMRGLTGSRDSVLWFDLELTDFYSNWKGKLIALWPGLERSWWRWADRNQILIHAIFEESVLDAAMPAWDELTLTRDELKILPNKWKGALTEWRGIYLILDVTDKKGYVGSAYGSDNILGRWLSYAASGHGGNKELRNRDPKNFLFSILQRVSPDMDGRDVIRLESTWKDRFHTRRFGMNKN